MTPEIWLGIIGVVVQVCIGAYVYGKTTGKIDEHDRRHSSHDVRFKELGDEQDRQWETIGRHAERISVVEAKTQGRAH